MAVEDYDTALERTESISKSSSKLLYLYEKGLILHYDNRYQESNDAFEEADLLYEDLYTKSITRELASLVTSDNVIKYTGERYEAALLHYYKIMNYLYLGDAQGALVECRRLSHRLQTFADDESNRVYLDDPFLQYFTGMIYLSQGEYNDAGVSFRAAVSAYEALGERYQVRLPDHIYCDMALAADGLGDRLEAEVYRAKGQCQECDTPQEGVGVINLLLECGYVPHKVENNIVIPIYKDEIANDVDVESYSETLYYRAGEPRNRKRKLAHLLKVSIPAMMSEPYPYPDAEARALGVDSLLASYARIVENVSALAVQSFEDRLGAIMVKTIARTLTKYLAKEGVEEKEGAIAGWLVNLFNVASESADTRSWTTLPATIRLSRLMLPPGTYDIEVTLYDAWGPGVEKFTITGIEIFGGQSTFINYRVY